VWSETIRIFVVLQSYQEGEVKLPDLDTISLGGVASQSKSLAKIIIPLLKQVCCVFGDPLPDLMWYLVAVSR